MDFDLTAESARGAGEREGETAISWEPLELFVLRKLSENLLFHFFSLPSFMWPLAKPGGREEREGGKEREREEGEGGREGEREGERICINLRCSDLSNHHNTIPHLACGQK